MISIDKYSIFSYIIVLECCYEITKSLNILAMNSNRSSFVGNWGLWDCWNVDALDWNRSSRCIWKEPIMCGLFLSQRWLWIIPSYLLRFGVVLASPKLITTETSSSAVHLHLPPHISTRRVMLLIREDNPYRDHRTGGLAWFNCVHVSEKWLMEGTCHYVHQYCVLNVYVWPATLKCFTNLTRPKFLESVHKTTLYYRSDSEQVTYWWNIWHKFVTEYV
jgi:hypothetical protein